MGTQPKDLPHQPPLPKSLRGKPGEPRNQISAGRKSSRVDGRMGESLYTYIHGRTAIMIGNK
eukprot:8110219-Karenia_brevis.AAC.1